MLQCAIAHCTMAFMLHVLPIPLYRPWVDSHDESHHHTKNGPMHRQASASVVMTIYALQCSLTASSDKGDDDGEAQEYENASSSLIHMEGEAYTQ